MGLKKEDGRSRKRKEQGQKDPDQIRESASGPADLADQDIVNAVIGTPDDFPDQIGTH
jgi:hypothetical protein